MNPYEIRPLYKISDAELNSRIEALKARGLTKDEIADTPEGKELYFRNLTDDQIIAICNQRMKKPGTELSDIPEYLERIRRRNIIDMESIVMVNPDIFGGKE